MSRGTARRWTAEDERRWVRENIHDDADEPDDDLVAVLLLASWRQRH